MKRFKIMGVVLLAVFAFSAIAAMAAQAEEAPYWSIEGTRLAAGKTAEITAKQAGSPGSQELIAGPVKITCTELKLKGGAVLLGSNGGASSEPGRSDETIEYSNCTGTGIGTPCQVNNGTAGKIVTEPLTNELVYARNSLVVVFAPASKKKLAVIHFVGTGCTVTEAPVNGVAAAGVYTDATPRVLLELPEVVTQAKSWILKLIRTTTTKIWLIKGGTGSEVTTEELTYDGTSGTLAGEVLLELTSGKLWSPLL
jgi:hypothetical protein